MSTSAKRRGLDPDPERELRFRRIEEELDLRPLANTNVASSQQRRIGTSVPQVTGVTLNTGIVGGVGVSWTASDVADVEYEVQYDTNAAFTSPSSTKTRTLETTLTNIGGTETAYVRVRALNNRGEAGDWSSAQNSSAGQASADNLQSGAASSITVRTKTNGFNPAVVNNASGAAQYLKTTLTFDRAADTLLIGLAEGALTLNANDTITIRLRVDGQEKVKYKNIPAVNSVGTITVPGLSVPVEVKAGQHTFTLEVLVEDTGAGSSSYTPAAASLAIWQVVR